MMLIPSDKDYLATKRIMQGAAAMSNLGSLLAVAINDAFSCKPVNIIYQLPSGNTSAIINVCFEFAHEREIFLSGNGVQFDKPKQEIIAQIFRELTGVTGNIWVYYSAFEPVAKIEANDSIPEEHIENLKNELKIPQLWEISRFSNSATFFLYTNAQAKHFANSNDKRLWADKYFDLLEPFDEFKYFKRSAFDICLDSKENFDTNYQSNWFYYYK